MSANYIHPEWSSGICDCCGQNGNPGFFCMACCCGGPAQGLLLKDLGLVSDCVGPVICYTILDLASARSFMALILASLRMNMAGKLQRKEGPCCSLCIACCCYPCALAQLDRDAKAPGRSYEFEKANGFYENLTTWGGAIHGGVQPYKSVEMAPLVSNSQLVSNSHS